MFLTRAERDTPPVMIWHVKHNRALHEHLFVLRVEILSVPWLPSGERLTIEEVAPNFWRAEAHFGFMERPHIPALLAASKSLGCTIDLADVTYYVGHETVIGRDDGMGLPGWQERFFAVMERNAVHVSDFFSLAERSGGRDRPASRDLISRGSQRATPYGFGPFEMQAPEAHFRFEVTTGPLFSAG